MWWVGLGVVGCGALPDGGWQRSPKASVITHFSPEEYARLQQPAYLVAFKSSRQSFYPGDSSHTMTHFRRTQTRLWDEYVTTGLAESSDFIAQWDMRARGYGPPSPSWADLPSTLAAPQDPEYSQMQISRMSFSSLEKARDVLEDLVRMDRIWYAEPDAEYQLQQQGVKPLKPYRDEYVKAVTAESASAYHIKMTKVDQALDLFAGLSKNKQASMLKPQNRPVIAILDSGVEIEHPALKGRAVDLTQFNSASCGRSKWGCNVVRGSLDQEWGVKGVLGHKNFAPEGSPQGAVGVCKTPKCNHGTHVAGLAVGYDPEKVYGSCPFCFYLPVRITQADGKIRDSAILRGLQFVSLFLRNGDPAVRIINLSIGKYSRSRSVEMMIRNLKNTGKGSLTFAAAGNEASTHRSYPAAFSDVVSVTAIGQDLEVTEFANSGYSVDLMAPGESLASAMTGGRTGGDSGTSQATPIVAGIAGLVLARFPQATADQLRHTLIETADRSVYESVTTKAFSVRTADHTSVALLGQGLVDARKAVQGIRDLESSRYITRVGCGAMAASLPDSKLHRPNLQHHPLFWLQWWLIITVAPGLILLTRSCRGDASSRCLRQPGGQARDRLPRI